jgi:hypothetical protein
MEKIENSEKGGLHNIEEENTHKSAKISIEELDELKADLLKTFENPKKLDEHKLA